MGDISAAFEALFRWMHVFAGILWIGHLYFFNFVNGQFEGKLDGGTKKTVIPELRPRALFWFRWGAAWTWVTGVLLLGIVYYMNGVAVDTNNVLLYDFLFKSPLAQNIKVASTVAYVLLAIVVVLFATFGNFSYRGTLIHTGAMFGTIMAFNVWFRIWPAQQKIIKAIKEGTAPDANLVKLAGLRSRQNTYLSLPLLWAMVGQHTTYFAGGNLGISSKYYWIAWLALIPISWHIIFQCYKKAGKVSGF
ncbi:MAG: hypothetical protein DMG08_00500 [Acidobacteria bacterium]|nr:MAG: hypothetical protein DMG08_00500 [Acidobacteriota bacterium]